MRPIDQDLLSDYQVVVVGVTDESYERLVTQRRIVKTETGIESDAASLAGHVGLAKAIRKYDLRRLITFHSRVKQAREFAKDISEILTWIPKRYRPDGLMTCDYVSGEMPTAQRTNRLKALADLSEEKRFLLSNARCLSEGVDVPALDGVAFVDPRRSEIDIVQAVGRAIRKSSGKDVGTIVIPVFINEDEDADEILSTSEFDQVWKVVNALRTHDDKLGEELDELRTQLGRKVTSIHLPSKIRIDLPQQITRDFVNAFNTMAVERTTESWNFSFGLLRLYKKRHGDCLVPLRAKTDDGFRLGSWVSHQRMNKDQLTSEKRQRLDDLGFVWDPLAEDWDQGFRGLQAYKEQFGNCLVPARYKTGKGFRLGSWVNMQRRVEDQMVPERKHPLDEIGFVWDPFAERWEKWFNHLVQYKKLHGDCLVAKRHRVDGELGLGAWVGNQRTLGEQLAPARRKRLDALGFVWDVGTANWEQGFQRLSEYKERYGNCLVPTTKGTRTGDGFNLGGWVSYQRHTKEELSPREIRRLDDLGFVWDRGEQRWEEGLEHLRKYKEQLGTCTVHAKFITDDGFRLGAWVSNQRGLEKQLTPPRRKRLDALGFVWDRLAEKWEDGFQHLVGYADLHGHCLVPVQYRADDGFFLGRWASIQKSNKHLSSERRQRLDTLGFIWDSIEEQWERGFNHFSEYVETQGDTIVPKRYKTEIGFALGQWVGVQRRDEDRLPTEKKRRLGDLGFIWDPISEQWERAFARLLKYKEIHGDCLVPTTYEADDGVRLGAWVRYQRTQKERLSRERRRRLNDIGFVWEN